MFVSVFLIAIDKMLSFSIILLPKTEKSFQERENFGILQNCYWIKAVLGIVDNFLLTLSINIIRWPYFYDKTNTFIPHEWF